jgi:hypothetical protein
MAISNFIYLALGFIVGLYAGSKSFREKVNSFLKSKKPAKNKGKDK